MRRFKEACCTQLRPKGATVTCGGAIRVSETHLGRGGCQKLAEQERAQSGGQQHGSRWPSQSPDDAGKWVESPVSRPQQGSPSGRGEPLLNGFLFGSR